MVPEANLRPITSARIAVIPTNERQAALDAMARKATQIPRQFEGERRVLTEDPDKDDIVIGLYARLPCCSDEHLTGIVRLRERFSRDPAHLDAEGLKERAYLIDALEIAEEMQGWNPPVRLLLVATAMTLIATALHDPTYRTYVACRAGHDGISAWPNELGGHLIHCAEDGSSCWSFDDVPTNELLFLDGDAAGAAANIVLDHMTGGIVPSTRYDLPGRKKMCRGMLSIEFPRLMRHLKDEIGVLTQSLLDVGWRTPGFADTGFPLRRAASG